jgi:cation transport regulator
MPYQTNVDLRNLSSVICPITRRTFIAPHSTMRMGIMPANRTVRGEPDGEERAHRIAWAAVKRSYVKVGNRWIAKAGA